MIKTNKIAHVGALLMLASLMTACGKKDVPEAPRPTPVRIQHASQGPAVPPIDTNGIVVTKHEMRLSFKMGGLVRRIYVQQGEAVKQGQRLAEIELTEVNAQVEQAHQLADKAERDLKRGENLYSDQVIYSPGVPVFRDDDGGLLDAAYLISFLTAAAPNRGALPRGRAAQVAQALAKRAARVLAVATAHGHRRLVLGAWGCGVFRNDPVVVAEAFAGALAEQAGHLDEVVFAIMDRTGSRTRAAFAGRFS